MYFTSQELGTQNHCGINLFSTNVPLLYPLKTSENRRLSDVFKGYRSRTSVENGLNMIGLFAILTLNKLYIYCACVFIVVFWTFIVCSYKLNSYDGGRYHIETIPLICSANGMEWFLYDNGPRHEIVNSWIHFREKFRFTLQLLGIPQYFTS